MNTLSALAGGAVGITVGVAAERMTHDNLVARRERLDVIEDAFHEEFADDIDAFHEQRDSLSREFQQFSREHREGIDGSYFNASVSGGARVETNAHRSEWAVFSNVGAGLLGVGIGVVTFSSNPAVRSDPARALAVAGMTAAAGYIMGVIGSNLSH